VTSARAKIEASLAVRGRPAQWANEQEAAALSGMAPEAFRQKLSDLEKRGFPQVNPDNGKRSIPHILAFWGLPQSHSGALAAVAPAQVDDEDGEEKWDGRDESQRRAS
jgi:hypothetical protein